MRCSRPRHLGIGAALAEQGDDVTLPVGERREAGGGAAAGRVCVACAVHQTPGRRPRKNGVPLRRHPYQGDQLIGRRGLEQVARRPGTQCPVHVLVDVRMLADGGQDASVWLCTGRQVPWAELWPRLRTLSVS